MSVIKSGPICCRGGLTWVDCFIFLYSEFWGKQLLCFYSTGKAPKELLQVKFCFIIWGFLEELSSSFVPGGSLLLSSLCLLLGFQPSGTISRLRDHCLDTQKPKSFLSTLPANLMFSGIDFFFVKCEPQLFDKRHNAVCPNVHNMGSGTFKPVGWGPAAPSVRAQLASLSLIIFVCQA